MNRIYIAAPIFNAYQLSVVRGITLIAKMLEYKYFSPYENSQGIWKGRAPKDCSQEERDQVLTANIKNLDWAELLMCWVGGTDDGKPDTGVVWEMGHFHALKHYGGTNPQQKRFTLAYIDPNDKRQNMNLMLAGTVDAVAMGPAQLHNAIKILRSLMVDASDVVREKFHPDKLVAHEREPIATEHSIKLTPAVMHHSGGIGRANIQHEQGT